MSTTYMSKLQHWVAHAPNTEHGGTTQSPSFYRSQPWLSFYHKRPQRQFVEPDASMDTEVHGTVPAKAGITKLYISITKLHTDSVQFSSVP